jgi:hypothetical protein
MNTRVIAGLALTGAAVLASCSQDRSAGISLPTDPSFAKGSAQTCSFSTATNDAKAYFSLQKDPVYALLDAMQTAYRNGGAAGATSAGFAVLARYAEATNLGLVKPLATVAGSKGVNDVLLCMGYTQTIDFSDALGPNGLFEVRDGSSNAAVVSHLVVNGYPGYGAEPKAGENWPLSTTVLFFGETLGGSSIAGQTAAGLLFDLRTLPTDQFTAGEQFLVGVCDVSSLSARTLHKHTGDPSVILPPAGIPGFCVPASAPPSSFLGGAKSLFASVFSVTPLYAMPLGGGGAGLVGGLSEIGPVTFVDSLAFQGQPNVPNAVVRDSVYGSDGDTTTSQFTPVVTVRAVSKGAKNPLVGVNITLSVIGNSGSFNPSGLTATTDNLGYARFPNFSLNKAGGYTITATSEFGPGSAITSNLFNVTGN